MNNYNIDIFSYIKTILWTLLAALIFLSFIIYIAQKNVIENTTSTYNDKMLKEYIKNTVIIQNEDLEAEYPDNYLIDMHLGYLYKTIKEYDKAEAYYKKAVAKAPLNVYKPIYELACFYIDTGKITEANEIIESLPHKSNHSLIHYQSLLYARLGYYYYEQGLYYNSLENYKQAIYYSNKINSFLDIKYIKSLKNSTFESAIALADTCVNSDRINDAKDVLKYALTIKPKDFNARYKYAIVTTNQDPETSYKYFSKLFKEDPTRIDYMAYYKLIKYLENCYVEEGDMTKAKLYEFRAQNLLDFVSKNLIYLSDVDFKINSSTLYNVGGKSKILIKFTLQNISNIPMKNLCITVKYKLNNNEIETITKTLADNTNPIAPGDSIIENTIISKAFRKYKKSDIPKISAEIYLYKTENIKLNVYNDYLFADRINLKTSGQNMDIETYIKFFVKEIKHFDSSLRTFKHSKH